MATKTFTCIVCPMSCAVTVCDDSGELVVTGNTCKNGLKFAQDEFTDPKRMLTTTVKVCGGKVNRLPVISSAEISKAKLNDCLAELYKASIKAPVKLGDVIAENILGTGVNIVAARDVVEA